MKTFATAALAVLAATAPNLQGQERPDGSGSTRGPSATAEARVGWDYRSEAPALGAALRFPLFGGRGDLVGGGDVVFRDGLTETQGHLDAVVVFGGRSGVTVGGGPLVLRSIFEDGGETETRTGYSAVAGLRQLPGPEESVGFTLELRWVFVDRLEPRYFTLGVGFPLFRMPF